MKMLEDDMLKSENELVLNSKVTELIKSLSLLVNHFNNTYEFEPGLYLYKKLITQIRKKEIERLLEDNKFIGLLYTTLWSWGMNIRGAKMKNFKSFNEEIKKNQENFVGLSLYQVIDLTSEQLAKIEPKIKKLYSNLHIMDSNTNITANSKIMHFILPDLIFPIDSKIRNFIGYFGDDSQGFYDSFLMLFKITRQIHAKVNLKEFILANKLDISIPKSIDNIITSYNDIKKKVKEK